MNVRGALFVLFVLMLCCFSANLFAITDEEIFRNFQFSFVNPGARSTAMGGAFIGLADDATAAVANPAGLTILTKPEVSFEYRGTRFDPDKLNSINSVSTSGVDLFIHSANNLDDLNQPSFLSVVFPAGGSTYAVSRQESVRMKGSIDESFVLVFPTITGTLVALADTDQKVVDWNFSYATKLSNSFSLGGSVTYAQLSWVNRVDNSVLFPDLGLSVPQFSTNIDATDNGFGFNIGMLAHLGKYASWGIDYKYNPKFSVTETSTGTGAFAPPEGSFKNELKIPDTFGTGFAIKPNDNITLNADLDYISYSQLTNGMVPGYNILTTLATPGSIAYKVDNAFEFHVGAEFVVIVKGSPIALREGYYRKPSNSLIVSNSNPGDRPLLDAVFTKRPDENHFTLGSGFVFGQHFQIDWAADLAKSTTSFVLSTVVRF